jgi:putative addiction module component (TIGR02574 family)
MVLTLDQLTKQALDLPAALRARLAEQLVESLADAAPDEIGRLWADEAVRRRDEVRSGRVKALSGEQVTAEVRRAVGRR